MRPLTQYLHACLPLYVHVVQCWPLTDMRQPRPLLGDEEWDRRGRHGPMMEGRLLGLQGQGASHRDLGGTSAAACGIKGIWYKQETQVSINPYAAGGLNLANTKWCEKPEKWLKPWQLGTHRKVLSESFPMSTNMTGFRWFKKIFVP